MHTKITRRDWFHTLLALPAIGCFSRYQALAEPARNTVKITAIKAMQVRDIAGNCLIKIETDQGLTGYLNWRQSLMRLTLRTYYDYEQKKTLIDSILEWDNVGLAKANDGSEQGT